MKMKKRAISLLLAFAMITGLFVGIKLNVSAVTYYVLRILNSDGNEVTVTDANKSNIFGDETASFDSDTYTLTLSGVNIERSFNEYSNYISYTGSRNLTLNLVGTNTIKNTNNSTTYSSDVIYAPNATLIIDGSGILNVEGVKNTIYAESIVISGGTINATSSKKSGIYAGNDVKINGGIVNATSVDEYSGIYGPHGVTINAGTVRSISMGNDSQWNCGIKTLDGGVIINGGDVYAEGRVGIRTEDNSQIIIGKNISSVISKGNSDNDDSKAFVGTVKNAVTGTGWTNKEGTAGETSIDANIDPGQTLTYKKVKFNLASSATVTTKPVANSLTYNGNEQQLVTPGQATGGTLQYALGTETEATTNYSTEIPKGKDAKTYYVWYKAVGDETHLDSDAKYVTSKINSVVPPTPTQSDVLEGGNQVVAYGQPASFEFDILFGLFQQSGKVYVDGVETDSKNYDAKPGSTIITLKDEFIKTLSEGAHEILVTVEGYEASTSFTVKKADAPNTDNSSSTESGTATASTPTTTTPTSTPTTTSKVTSPKTGDTIPIAAILILALGIGTIGIAALKNRE